MNFEKFTSIKQPITALQTPDYDWLLHRFIEVYFSKLTKSNQIFLNDFEGLHYHLRKNSSQIIECIIFAPEASYTRQKNCVTDAASCVCDAASVPSYVGALSPVSPKLQSPATQSHTSNDHARMSTDRSSTLEWTLELI